MVNPMFMKALQPAAVGANGLNNTMAGNAVAPPAAPTDPNAAISAPYDEQIKAAEDQLNNILSSQPGIDYEGKYKSLLDQIQSQPVEKAPNPATSFAYALGAPDTAPALLHEKILRGHAEEEQKQASAMKLKETLLQGSIQQEVEKGNFASALKQSEKLAEIQRINADRERALNMRDWKEKQVLKTQDAKTLLKQKVNNIVSSFHLDEKMRLALLNHGMSLIQGLMNQKDITGEPFYQNMDTDTLIEQVLPQLYDYAKSAGKGAPPSGNENKSKPAAESTKEMSPYAKALKEIREGKK